MKKSQCDILIEYLDDHKTITTMTAFNQLGIARLSARIYELTKRGYIFDRNMIKVNTRYGKPAYVMSYQLIGREGDAA